MPFSLILLQAFLLHLREEAESYFLTPDQPTDARSSIKPISESVANSTTALARLLLTLTRNSIQRFHHERSAKLDMILNQERWQATPVPSRVQELVSRTFLSALPNGTQSDSDLPGITSGQSNPVPRQQQQQQTSPRDEVSSALNFGNERFVVVGTVLLLLPMLVDYVNLAPRLPCWPGSVAELASRLAELLNVSHLNQAYPRFGFFCQKCLFFATVFPNDESDTIPPRDDFAPR
ncbi:unnamed protein product [Echinostoma caproni]|uniref:Vps54 domain-containing protein n=1 Tax=Echinostoma caproni TaxID=27848 RepID=A0A183AXB5_9TREM|nr:unnamed protein product [Echinostoma caproni]